MSIVGKRVRLEYGDQNYSFESIFPREGKILSRHKTENVDDWYLIDLDNSFQYKGKEHKQILIRSRWQGKKIGRLGITSVFVLLINNKEDVSHPEININNFDHVVWAEAKII
jgi:hypothetical protein